MINLPNQYVDGNGNQQAVKLDIPAVARLKTELDVDLIGASADINRLDSELKKLVDPVQLVSALAIIQQPEDPETFGRSFASMDIVDAAFAALMEAVCDFFGHGAGERLRTLWRKSAEIHRMDRATALAEVDRKIDEYYTD